LTDVEAPDAGQHHAGHHPQGKKIKHTSAIKLFDKKKPKNNAASSGSCPGTRPEAGLKSVPPLSASRGGPADRREGGLAQILGLFASAAGLLVLRLVP
jgi:hypothetical protein